MFVYIILCTEQFYHFFMICYYAIICVYVFNVKMTSCAIREFLWEGMEI